MKKPSPETGVAPGRARPPAENFPRSIDTRRRILEAARRIFASVGYEKTTIRGVAAEAGIDPSMVMRYYGSKDGLFAAAAEFDLRPLVLGATPRDQFGVALVRHFLETWEGPKASQELPLLVRSAATNADLAAQLHEIMERQVAPVVAGLSPPRRAQQCSALITAELMGLAFTRYVLQTPVVAALTPRVLVERLGAALQSHIDAHAA